MPCQFIARKPELIHNLLRIYGESTPEDRLMGCEWYPKAHQTAIEWGETYGYSIATVANVVAALSPQIDWNRNLIVAHDLLSGQNPSVGGCLLGCVNKAKAILRDRAGDIRDYFPQGPKVYHFAQNLMGNYVLVTVDTHATQAALNDVTSNYHLKWTPYGVFEECYQESANIIGMEPAMFQAIIWLGWKRKYPRMVKKQLRRK